MAGNTVEQYRAAIGLLYEPTRVTQSTSTLIDSILVINKVSVFDSGTLVVGQNISDQKCTYSIYL